MDQGSHGMSECAHAFDMMNIIKRTPGSNSHPLVHNDLPYQLESEIQRCSGRKGPPDRVVNDLDRLYGVNGKTHAQASSPSPSLATEARIVDNFLSANSQTQSQAPSLPPYPFTASTPTSHRIKFPIQKLARADNEIVHWASCSSEKEAAQLKKGFIGLMVILSVVSLAIFALIAWNCVQRRKLRRNRDLEAPKVVDERTTAPMEEAEGRGGLVLLRSRQSGNLSLNMTIDNLAGTHERYDANPFSDIADKVQVAATVSGSSLRSRNPLWLAGLFHAVGNPFGDWNALRNPFSDHEPETEEVEMEEGMGGTSESNAERNQRLDALRRRMEGEDLGWRLDGFVSERPSYGV